MLTPNVEVKRTVVRLAVVLVALQAVFLGLLVLAQAVPDDPIVDHLLQAVEDGTYLSNSAPDNMGGRPAVSPSAWPSAPDWDGRI